jgi:hypothetical protein
VSRPVCEDTEQWKQIGPSLDLVDHDDAAQRLEGQASVAKPRHVRGVFEVEDCRTEGAAFHHIARQRSLAHPARAEDSHDRMAPEQAPDAPEVAGAGDVDALNSRS